MSLTSAPLVEVQPSVLLPGCHITESNVQQFSTATAQSLLQHVVRRAQHNVAREETDRSTHACQTKLFLEPMATVILACCCHMEWRKETWVVTVTSGGALSRPAVAETSLIQTEVTFLTQVAHTH